MITTVAGSTFVFRGEGGPAPQAPLGDVEGLVFDAAGNLYVSDRSNNQVYRITAGGIITVAVGNGIRGFSGDGGPATAASLNAPVGLAVDARGDLYLVDSGNGRVRKVDSRGVITTVAGGGSGTPCGEGPATSQQVNAEGIALDAAGNLYIADKAGHCIRRVDPSGMMTTFAGNGTAGYSGDGGPARSAQLQRPIRVAVNAAGNVYIADQNNYRIRKVDAGGVITTFAGTGSTVPSGDDGPAISAGLGFLRGISFDRVGNLYVVGNGLVRRIATDGTISKLAGGGTLVDTDGTAALGANLNTAVEAAVDSAGTVYFVESAIGLVRRIVAGILLTFAGSGQRFYGDGGPATSAALNLPVGVAVDTAGNLYIADTANNRVRKVDSRGVITTIAGNGQRGFSGEGGPAILATLNQPMGVAADRNGNVFVSDSFNHRVRRITPGGVILTYAGNGIAGFNGDGAASEAQLSSPQGLAVDPSGNLFIAEGNRVRRVDPQGNISTVAGNGTFGFGGDGGPALGAALRNPRGVALDTQGDLYIADTANRRIRKVAGGIITTIAGGGTGGDGGPAVLAALSNAQGVAVDASGVVYYSGERVRAITPDGMINAFAGGGWSLPDLGDGGPPEAAVLGDSRGVTADAAGNVYIVDYSNGRIRKVSSAPATYTLSATNVAFNAAAASGDAAPQPITIKGTAALTFTVQTRTTSGGSWLSATPAAAQMPATLTITVDAFSLAPGNYSGVVEVRAPLAQPPLQTIAVSLTVGAPLAPQQSVQPASLSFVATEGSRTAATQSLRVSNSGGGSLNWTARAETFERSGWLTVSPGAGVATARDATQLTVTVNPTGLSAGAYTGRVIIGQTNIPVNLLIAAVRPSLLLSQSGMALTGVEGARGMPPGSFGIVNIGQGTMNWRLSAETLAGGAWLTAVAPGGGTTGQSEANSLEIPIVEVRVNLAGLRSGQYTGLVRVDAQGATNSPQYVTVDLTVLPAGSRPGPQVRPTGLIFAARAGAVSPGSQALSLMTASASTVEARAGVVTFDGNPWLEVAPGTLALTAGDRRQILVQPSLGTLAPGIYRGAMTLVFADDSPPQTASFLFLILPSQGAEGEVGAAACIPARLHAMQRTLSGTFTARAGTATNLEAQVLDDCGNAVTGGTVVAEFSNGDPPLALASLRNGLYSGTWIPVRPAASATVTLRASQAGLSAAAIVVSGRVEAGAGATYVFPGGVVNGASFAANEAVAPGGIVSLFGRNLAAEARASSLPLPKVLGGATVEIGGVQAPLFYSSEGQINAQIPFEAAAGSNPQVVVRGAGASIPEGIVIAAARPGIFLTGSQQQGAILDAQFRLVDRNAPAAAGAVVAVFATGLGLLDQAVVTGAASPASPPAKVVLPVSATIGGIPAAVQFAGLAPGYAGLYQVNVQVPAAVAGGDAVPLILTQAGVASNTVTLAVR